MKKVGIIGSGAVARALAAGFAEDGHPVMMGSRSPEKLRDFAADSDGGIRTGTFSECASYGDIIVLAVKGTVARSALDLAGKENLSGKTVIDACNPIADIPPTDGVLHFFTDANYSLMEMFQEAFPQAHFVKAFSCVGSAHMVRPGFGSRPTMFICGNHPGAKSEVAAILERFGWDTADMGSAVAARAIEPLCRLWCIPGFRENKWDHAFKMLVS